MTLSPYQQKATDIIKESIKSAIFIDENARPFYEPDSGAGILEEKLSVDLFENFKDQGISLAIHKFKKSDLSNVKLKEYLLDARDLVLLDWKLDGKNGEEYALKLLSEIVNKSHIHFCSIYTSEKNQDLIFKNILSYFSGETQDYYDKLKIELTAYEDDINEMLSDIDNISLNRNDSANTKKILGKLFSSKRDIILALKEETKSDDNSCALIKVGIAFQETLKSKTENPCPEIISFSKKSLVINNTIITILNKNLDKDPKELIDKMALQIADSNKSYTQLLGLEMQNIFSKKGSFIDSNLLDVSEKTILYHRNQLKSEYGRDLVFQHLIKNVLIEQASLTLGNEDLTLLDSALLDSMISPSTPPSDDELISMNVFYNSIKLKRNQRLDFGDVFYDNKDDDFYLCITALCDAIRPEKIKNRFRFVKGKKMKNSTALKVGDSGFISFLANNEAVVWSNVDSGDPDIDKYKPVYVKPLVFNVEDPNFENNKIEIRQIFLEELRDEDGNEIKDKDGIGIIDIEYVSTIKQQYTQRIANHAFTHPVRVGVDFVKKK